MKLDLTKTNGSSPPINFLAQAQAEMRERPGRAKLDKCVTEFSEQSAHSNPPTNLTVPQAAQFLGVSKSWVRRHIAELPVVHLGRLIRFDSLLLSQQFQGRIGDGKSLKPERNKMIRYQRGSCYLKGKKQKMWYGVYRADVMTPNGPERQQIKVVLGTLASLPTKNAAQMKLSDIIHHQTVSVQPEDITYAELAKRWEQADGPSYDQTTREAYVNALRIYILPTFANRKIASITREGVQNFLNAQAKNYSRSTLATMKTMLKLTLGWAADSDLIRRNPCEGKLRVPVETGGRTIKRTILSPNQVVSIAQKLEEPYATLVLLLYFGGGVRIGEALELRDSDFNGCVVHISRKLYRGKVGKVKSKASNRTIKLPNWLVSKLLDLPRVGGSDLIFQSPVGTHLDPGTALARKVRPACVELGITIGGQHDFRHSMSNALRKAGTHPKVVAGILGHAKADLAVDTYDQTSLEERSEALASVTRLLPKVTQNAESPVN